MLKKTIIIAILTLSSGLSSFGKQVDNKYLQSIIYIQSNQELNISLRKVFKRSVPKKSRPIKFHVSDRIVFKDIELFKEEILALDKIAGFDPEILSTWRAFGEQYGFKSFSDELLGKVLLSQDPNLKIYFSKPIGNLLAAEIVPMGTNMDMRIRFGTGYNLLFVFNGNGLIEEVHWKPIMYN